jgi:Uma2 family endonuclease
MDEMVPWNCLPAYRISGAAMLNNCLAQEMCMVNLNTSATSLSGTMDIDEFMAFVETRPDEEHWELIEGVAVMMAPASYAHQRIVWNLCELLNCVSFSIVPSRHGTSICSPILTLASVGRASGTFNPSRTWVPGIAGYDLHCERFQLVAEVLSPTNRRQEIDLKLRRYREAPDNLYAVVIEPREFLLEIYAKRGNWQSAILTKPDDSIEMPEFGLRCGVAALYRGTPLDPATAAGTT